MSKKKTHIVRYLVVFSFYILVSGMFTVGMTMEHEHGPADALVLHQQHMMLNQALVGALEGSNVVMLGQMGMSLGIDDISLETGKKQLMNAHQTWNELMSGQIMSKMHAPGMTPAEAGLMRYSHRLAKAQLKVMDVLYDMDALPHTYKAHDMTMHHEHILLNHALKLALEGSNLIMLGHMGMAKGIDNISVNYGKMMMRQALSVFNEVISGQTLTDMLEEGVTPENDPLMAYTYKLAEAQLTVVNMLSDMPLAE
jgi:hypothetical protein